MYTAARLDEVALGSVAKLCHMACSAGLSKAALLASEYDGPKTWATTVTEHASVALTKSERRLAPARPSSTVSNAVSHAPTAVLSAVW